MRQLLLILICFSFVLPCSAQWGRYQRIKGNGDITKEERRGDDFSGVTACCSMEVFVTKGDTYSITVEADANLMEYIITEIEGDVLVIKIADKTNLDPSRRIRVYVTTPVVDYLKSSSSSDLICKGAFEGDDLKLKVSSSGYIGVDFTGRYVEARSSSSGKIDLRGAAESLNWKGSSSSRINAVDFSVKEATASGSSSARLKIRVSERLDAKVSSSARVEYLGEPEKLFSNASSGGKVRKL